jgi:hypothetical protein
MGCSSCKSKNSQNKNGKKVKDVTFENVEGGNSESPNDLSIDKTFLNGLTDNIPKNIFLRLITFSAVVIVLPLLSVYLILHIFGSLFFTKDGKINLTLNWLINGLSYPFKKWKSFRQKVSERAKKRKFDENRGYTEESELTDVDVFTSEEIKQKKEYTGEEELEGVELLETTNKDNDNE